MTESNQPSGLLHSLQRSGPLLPLLVMAPVPSLALAMAMRVAPGPVGQTVFALAKVWLLVFPAVWWLFVERGKLSWSPLRHGGMGVGAALGVVVGVAIAAAFWGFAADRIDAEELRQAVHSMGLDSPGRYIAGSAFWILINSLMEEYVYRWFILRQCGRLMPAAAALPVSALIFTAHHVIALQVFLDPALATLASVGVFIGGALWSWCYLRYGSIWPGWLSHVAADSVIFALGWFLIFA